MSRRPRRKKKSPASRLRPFWLLIVLAAVLAGFGGYYAATWPGFHPRNVSVSGNRVVPAQQIAARAGIVRYENVWLQNMGKAADRIAAIPYVRSVQIHRALPANVRIVVTERVPYARLRYDSETALADRDLRVLQDEAGPSTLPVFVVKEAVAPKAGSFVKDTGVQRLRDDYDALTVQHIVVASLQYDKFGDLIATMRNGVQLLLGDDSTLSQTARLVGPILSQVGASGRKIAKVDLRAPKTPVVVFKK